MVPAHRGNQGTEYFCHVVSLVKQSDLGDLHAPLIAMLHEARQSAGPCYDMKLSHDIEDLCQSQSPFLCKGHTMWPASRTVAKVRPS